MNDPEVMVFETQDESFAVHVCACSERVVVSVHSRGGSNAMIAKELSVDEFMVLAHQMGRAANIISRKVME